MENGVGDGIPPSNVDDDEPGQQSSINISDVIDVIRTTDPAYRETVQTSSENNMFGGSQILGAAPAQTMLPTQPGQLTQPTQPQAMQMALLERKKNTIVRIVEQPASKALRFRYECEGRSAGSIPGIHSSPENKTYPSIEIVGYKGRAVVVVSCVTKDPPYRPHPHNLVGKDGCKKGVCTVEINSESMCVSFSNLGIQCVKRKDLEEALRVREEIRVDPFRTGFSHRNQPTSIDLNAVRLCFQVFLEGEQKGRFTLPLSPVMSDVIYDKKAMSDLVICKLSHCSASVAGGKEIILLCEKVAKEDISVRFYEEVDNQIDWEAWGDFQHANVHKQVAISFRTPRYKNQEVDQVVKVFIQLRRPSDGATSEALPFELIPLDSDPVVLKRKRQKFGSDPTNHLLRHLQQSHQEIANMEVNQQSNIFNLFNPTIEQPIKLEPRDQTPSPYGASNLNAFGNMYRVVQNSPSPQHYVATPSPPLNIVDYQQPGPMWNIPPMQSSPGPSGMQQPIGQQMSQQIAQTLQQLPEALQPIPQTQQTAQQIHPESHATLSSLLMDMDSQQLHQYSLPNSTELTGLASLLDGTYQNPDRAVVEQENMTDSFTRLTTNALNELTAAGQFNSFVRPQ